MQSHVDGEVTEGEVKRAIVVARDNHLVEQRVLARAQIVGEGIDDGGGQVAQCRASVEEDGELLVRVRLGRPLAVGDGNLVQIDPVASSSSSAICVPLRMKKD